MPRPSRLPWIALVLAACGGAPAEPTPSSGPWFTLDEDAFPHRNLAGPTAAEGKRHLLDCIGPGLATLDADGDGRLDVYFPQGHGDGDPRNLLYRNRGGRAFERVAGAAGADDDGYSFGALAFDRDADGDADLLVTNLGPNVLYRNDGGRFADVSATAPDASGAPEHWSTGDAAGDGDGDGDLDVYLANYFLHDAAELDERGLCRFMGCEVPCGPQGMVPQPDRLLVNGGAPGFALADGTAAAGLAAVPESYGFQPVFTDADDDGDLDLYVANDSEPNWLFVNDGRGRFEEAGLPAGVSHGASGQSEAGMGVAVADLDGDLRPDVYVTNFSSQTNALYRNTGGADFLWFDESAHRAAIGHPTFFMLSWGCTFGDFDGDGALDLFVANGHVYPQVDGCPPGEIAYRQRDSLFLREPGAALRFRDAAAEAGPAFATLASSRGAVAADLDGDGALDLVATRLDEPPWLAWNDTPRRGHWLQLTLQTGTPPVLAVGARAVVDAGGVRRSAEVRAGSGFLSTEDPRLHFGLGAAERVDRLEVRFPSGTVLAVEDLDVDRHLVVRENGEVVLGVAGGPR